MRSAVVLPILALAACASREEARSDVIAAPARSPSARLTNAVEDPGFEQQTSGHLTAPWRGGATTRIESARGAKHALLEAASGWNAVEQWVPVKPFTHYVASVTLSSSDALTGGTFAARGDASFETAYAVSFTATRAWRTLRFELDTAADSSMLLYVGFWGNGTYAALRVDDLALLSPAASPDDI